jgi:hypothetical protein
MEQRRIFVDGYSINCTEPFKASLCVQYGPLIPYMLLVSVHCAFVNAFKDTVYISPSVPDSMWNFKTSVNKG